jgi:hypothetical protein
MVQATGNVRRYQVVVSGILLMNLPFSYLLLKLGFAPQVTFIVSIVSSFGALLARLIVLKRLVSFPVKIFLNSVLYRVVPVFIIASIFPYYISTQISSSLKQFSVVLVISFLSVISTVWLLGITNSKRIYCRKNILKFFSKNKFM